MKSKKLLLIGIDQSIPYLLNQFMDEGILPNIANLVENGVYGEALSCAPCDTPTNWATIATGATTAKHGVTSFYMHLPGEELDLGMKLRSRTQLSKYCEAEFVWDVASRQKLVPFIMNYPSGWPGNFKRGAMSLYSWKIPESFPVMVKPSIISRLEMITENESKLIAYIPINNNSPESDKFKLRIHIDQEYSIDYGRKDTFAPLVYEKWSKWMRTNIDTEYGILPVIFRFKVLGFDTKKQIIKIHRSALYNLKNWTNPDYYAEKLVMNAFEYDLPEETEVEFMIYGSKKIYLKSAREESDTLARSINYSKKELAWDLCYFHYHPLDTINHDSLAFLHKDSPLYSEKNYVKNMEYVRSAYRIVDEMTGTLLNGCVDDQTVVVFVSDHGAIPIWKIVNIPIALRNAELISYNWNDPKKMYEIDWNTSVCFPYMDPPFIWVNLKDRDPNGIVERKDYDEIIERIIETLYSIKDPENNQKVVKLALRKEDASQYGLDGERVGDIIYFLNSSYGLFDGDLRNLDASKLSKKSYMSPVCHSSRKFFGAHAYYLPETKFGDFSIAVPLIISGPGIRKGQILKDRVRLTDLVPTFSKILDIPTPKQSEGRVINEVFN